MIGIYKHWKKHVCKECFALLDYACFELDYCKSGEKKPTYKKSSIYCYKPVIKEQMRETMLYAGPHMFSHYPIATIRHIIRE